MTLGIYCYVDKKDNQIVYVGKDSHLDENRRHKQHYQSCYYPFQQINKVLQNNPNRYTYQVLVWNVEDQETLNALEIQYIRQLNPKFNFTDGGEGLLGFTHSEETKKKISESNKGKFVSKESRMKMSKSQKLRKREKHSAETRQKMRLASLGKKNHNYGKPLTEETKRKLSESLKGRKVTDSHRKHLSETRNTTGFYRVIKMKDSRVKQGFSWLYSYRENNHQVRLQSTDFFKLRDKVKMSNLEWSVINEANAKKTLEFINQLNN